MIKRKEWIVIGLLIAIKMVLPFVLSSSVFELHRDEYLYYEQGHHLAFGYLENPPLIGLMAAISSLFGGSFFWIKFWPVLFGGLTLLITIRIVKELGGGLYAQVISSLGIIFSAYLRTHFLFQPNFLDIFFWSLSAYYLLRYINTQSAKYVFLLAFSLVLGWYGKYSVLFFLIALLLSLLLTYHRTIFLRRDFGIALIAGLVFIVPNLLWQYFHNWPLIHHMKELQETQLQHLNRIDFIKEQLLMLFPVAFLWIGGLVWLLRNKKYRIIGYCYLLIILLLMMGSGKGYYALGAYPMMLAGGGVWAERLSIKKRWLRYAFALIIIALSLPFVPVLLPMQKPEAMAAFNKKYGVEKIGVLKWEDGNNHPLQQDFADMLGWEELTIKSENFFYSLSDSVQQNTIIYCRNYGLAGGTKYFAKGSNFRNKIYSDNGSFLLWIPSSLFFRNIILLGRDIPDKEEAVFRHFETMRIVDSCNNPLSRQYGYKIMFFGNGSDSARVLAKEGIRKEQQVFQR